MSLPPQVVGSAEVHAVEVGVLQVHRIEGPGEALQIRIGLHTGPVIIGAEHAAGYLTAQAMGDTPHLAARLQAAAEPNTVLLSPTTARQVRTSFVLEKLATQRLKGFSREMPVYRVRKPQSGGSGEPSAFVDLTSFIGRCQELGQGRRQWRRAQAGRRQGLQIVGEPGIGKSCLIRTLAREASREGGIILECRCSPYYQHSALYPFIELLQREFGLTRADSRETHYQKLAQGIEAFGLPVNKTVPLLGRLLSVADRDPFPTLTPHRARERTLELLSALLTARAEHGPTILVLEDLQWADPSTLELTEKLTTIQDPTPLLWVLSHRSDFALPLTLPTDTVRMELGRLTQAQSMALLTRIAGKPLPHDVVQHLLAQSDGVPLFLEELTKAVLESGILQEKGNRYERQGPFPTALLPDTLLDSLMPRFDRLGEALPVAQVAAVLGREFSYALLEAVARQPRAQLRRALETLQAAQLLFGEGGDGQEASYTFKHALIRDAVYRSLLKSQRQPIHGRIARALEKKFSDIARRQPELVAYHYQEAALYDLAIDYWQKAGLRALEHSANHEAIGHFKQGLALLLRLPDTAERQQKELLLQSALGVPLTMTQGYSAPEVERTYARALALSQTGGVPGQRFTALRGLWVFYLVKAEYRTALKLSKQLLHIAQSTQDPDLLMEAQATLGVSLFYCSDVTRARAHLGEALDLYRPKAHRLHAFLYGRDPGVACGSFNAWALLLLGYPDQAKQAMAQTVQLAERQAHPFSLAYVLNLDAKIHQICRDSHLTEQKARVLMALSQEQGFPLFLSAGMLFEGWSWVEKGQAQEGIARMQQGIKIWQSIGAKLAQTYWSALLAEACGMTGQAAQGQAIIAEGFSTMHKNREIFYKAELYRVQGELLLRLGAFSAAESSFQQALAVAQQQKAKLLELRAATSLGRLWRETGKRQKARKLLEEIYRWFTEGFDTTDLQQAKALLSELN